MLFRRPPPGGALNDNRQREKFFQLGLFLVLMMVLLDARTSHPTPAEDPTETSTKAFEQLQAAVKNAEGDGRVYPVNVSGHYTGNWSLRAQTPTPLSKSSRTDLNSTSSSDKRPEFKLTSNHGQFSMQVFMEPLEGLPELSLVRGVFQIVGDSHEPMRHQLTSSVQGVFFHSYGRVTMVTSQEHLYLKGRQALPGKNASASLSLADVLATPLPGSGSSPSPAARQVAQALKDPVVRRRLEAQLEASSPESAAAAVSSAPLLGLGLSPSKVPAGDQDAFVFPIPSISSSSPSTPLKASSSSTSKCLFLMNLKAGPSCDSTTCPPKKAAPQFATTLEGRIFSQNCAVDIELSSSAFRVDWDRVYPKAARYSLLATVLCLIQIALLFRQLHFTEPPAAAARVSVLCISAQALLDALECAAHLLGCAFLPQLFTAFASIAFFKLVIFLIVEMRYVVVICHSRDPQRFFNGGINQLRQEWALIHLRFYGTLFACIMAVYIFQTHINLLVLLGYCYWVPQIVTNALRESREALHKSYLFGMSAARLVMPLYYYGCPQNLALVILGKTRAPHFGMCFALVAVTGAQIGALLLQKRLGPRFFIPARFLPARYDYCRPLPRRDLEENSDSFECPICYAEVETSVARSSGHMITPCDHVFHETCLERWMEQKLECPVCRNGLPPR